MQGPTHILAGVIINRLFRSRDYMVFSMLGMLVTGLFFHGLFDKLAQVTYHPANADFSDPFWVGYHTVVWLSSIAMLYIFWGEYKWGIIFSLLPDFDWIIVHGQHALGITLPVYNRPLMHDTLNLFFDNVPPFSFLNQLPDNRLNPLACVWEIALVAILILIIRMMINYRKNIHFGK
jgi:hypothetical protein